MHAFNFLQFLCCLTVQNAIYSEDIQIKETALVRPDVTLIKSRLTAFFEGVMRIFTRFTQQTQICSASANARTGILQLTPAQHTNPRILQSSDARHKGGKQMSMSRASAGHIKINYPPRWWLKLGLRDKSAALCDHI